MTEHPILFNKEMVIAILDGRKTQTRRIAKDRRGHVASELDYTGWPVFEDPQNPSTWVRLRCPYGTVGDRLWVREAHCFESDRECKTKGYNPPFTDGRPVRWVYDPERGLWWMQAHYRATDPAPDLAYDDNKPACRWRPSIHMPRWASRITLEITDIKAERLQNITCTDAYAEGCLPDPTDNLSEIRTIYQAMWDSISTSRSFLWDKNPLVWTMGFKLL